MADLYTPSSAPLGDFKASVFYSKYLGVQAMQALTLRTGLTGRLPEGRDPTAGKVTTTPGMPIVQSWDLQKMSGDRVTIDMKGRFIGRPQMNDAVIVDRKESLRYARDEIAISLYNHVGDPGGIMTRQRNPHDTRMDVMDATIRWLVDLEDNLFMIHAAGARGTQQSTAWVVPLDSDSDFAAIAGQQQPTPPTRNRYSIPGGTATGLDNIDTTCTLDLDFLTGIRAKINTSNVPLSPVSSTQLNGNGAVNGNSQLLVGLLSEEQWMTLKTATGDNSFTQMVLAANTRMDFNKHPAFADLERFLWAGILWFKCPRAIEFAQGASAKQYNATTGALETVTVAQRAHRGLVLGAQAIGVAYGDSNPPTSGARAGNGGTGTTSILKSPYSWREDVRQGGGVIDIYGRMMGGYKKLVYSWPDPVTGTLTPFDNGVYAFDTYQAGL